MNDPQRTDGELLASFAEAGSEAALAELMARHGPMVHGVALRVLADHHEAQDVTQAVFCTLARKANRLRRDASVGGWLHRVAWCLAMDVRASRARRQRREEEAMQMQTEVPREATDRERFREELDDALNRLPERYRRPVVLFHIEGHSLDATARLLGVKSGTVGWQLARAREMLRAKLVRRGVAVGSASALTALLSAEAGAAVLPAEFVSATVKAAGLAAAGKLAAGVGTGVVSAKVVGLVKGACEMLFWSSVKTAAVVTAACAVVAGTGVVIAQRAPDKADGVVNTIASPPVEAVTTNNGIVMTTMLPKTIWMEKEPLKFTVRLENITKNPIDVGKTRLYPIILTDAILRQSYSPRNHGAGRYYASELPAKILQPKEDMTVDVDLSRHAGVGLWGGINTNVFDTSLRAGQPPKDGRRHPMPEFLPAGSYDLRVLFGHPDHQRTDIKPGTWTPIWKYSSGGLPDITPARIRIESAEKPKN